MAEKPADIIKKDIEALKKMEASIKAASTRKKVVGLLKAKTQKAKTELTGMKAELEKMEE